MTATAKRRPRRIAADEAHAWARNLRLNNPLGKLTLSMLTLYVNGEGSCFVSIEQLSEDTELAPDTVRKRLAWLETVGAIARLPQWVDASGRRNGEGRGRRTSDEIRLLIDTDEDVIEARAAGDVSESTEHRKNDTDGHDAEISPRSVTPSHHGRANGTSPRLAPGQPSDSSQGLISEPEPEESPHSPPSGGVTADELSGGEASEAWPHLETWRRFEAAFHEPILHQRQCRQLWEAFTDAERETAITVAAGYVAWRTAQRKPPNVINAVRLLRERDAWASFAVRAPRARPVEAKERTRIVENSAEFIALHLACQIAGRDPPRASGDPPSIEIVGDVPNGATAMAMLATDHRPWIIRKKGTPEFEAWCTRIAEWIGRRPEHKRFWLDEQGNVVDGPEKAFKPPGALVPRAMDGLCVPETPTGFPPPKGADPPREDESAA